MRLKVLLPSKILLQRKIRKIVGEGGSGAFCLLPRHIDFVAGLVPGILSFLNENEEEEFVAVDEGILVKCGDEVLVSTRNAMLGPDLGKLRDTVEKEFQKLDDREKQARSASARLEADMVRRFMELKHHGHG